jgi:hypothetical protein
MKPFAETVPRAERSAYEVLAQVSILLRPGFFVLVLTSRQPDYAPTA